MQQAREKNITPVSFGWMDIFRPTRRGGGGGGASGKVRELKETSVECEKKKLSGSLASFISPSLQELSSMFLSLLLLFTKKKSLLLRVRFIPGKIWQLHERREAQCMTQPTVLSDVGLR